MYFKWLGLSSLLNGSVWFQLFLNKFGLPFLKWFGLNGLRAHKRFGLVFVLYKLFCSIRSGFNVKKLN